VTCYRKVSTLLHPDQSRTAATTSERQQSSPDGFEVEAFTIKVLEQSLKKDARPEGRAASRVEAGEYLLERVPNRLHSARQIFSRLRSIAEDAGPTPYEIALGHAHHHSNCEWLVMGCDTSEQLQVNCQALANPPVQAEVLANLDELRESVPIDLIDPTRWSAE
jgi:aryl-alcohol dehydrogenase-like predicted oxidoreductase